MLSEKNSPASQKQVTVPPPATHRSTEDHDKAHFAITIGKSPAEVFSFLKQVKNLPKFIKEFSASEATWSARVTQEQKNKRISWISTDDSPVETAGTVWLEEVPLGTELRLSLNYKMPGGVFAEVANFFTGDTPQFLILGNLKRLKAYLETGEIATTEGQSSGRSEGATR